MACLMKKPKLLSGPMTRLAIAFLALFPFITACSQQPQTYVMP